jgi:beta-glucosidase
VSVTSASTIVKAIAGLTLEEKASLTAGKDFWTSAAIERLGIPSAFFSDGPHGMRKQALAADHLGLNESLKATCFPTAAALANSWNTELAEGMGEKLGAEAKAQGVNVVLGPGVNIKRNPLCGRNFEYYSEDPLLAGKMAAAFIRGIQKNGVSACVKHFAANSQETRRMVSDSIIDERALREIYLEPFELAVTEGGTKAVMTSYNLLNGVYANESPKLLTDILRREWGFGGAVITDWGGCNDKVESIKAGSDLEMPTNGGETAKEVVKAVKEGSLKESALDESLSRLLELIFSTSEALADKADFDKEAHHQFALKAAEESVVLLENSGVLPLAPGTKVCLIGDFAKNPRYQGAGSSVVNPTKLDTVLGSIGESGLEFCGFEPGFKRMGGKSAGLVSKALELAQKADVVLLFCGLNEIAETEGLDRTEMRLPDNQLELIEALKKTGKKVVLVLSCGSQIETGFAKGLDAVLYASLGGQAGAKAVLNILSGKTNPSGKLAETFPEKYEDCPSSKNYPGTCKTAEYRESVFVGYRHYETVKANVSYPFGYGLSYTKFEYSSLSIDKSGASFSIKNTGARAGAEIAQLYISMPGSALFRPDKELKGFTKVAIAPGETQKVFIPFDERTFRVWNADSSKWAVEDGVYKVHIGASIKDIRLSGEISVSGEKIAPKLGASDLPSYYSRKANQATREEFEKLLGRPLPSPDLDFVKKNRIICGMNTAVEDLRYAKGWPGRLFAGALKLAYNVLRLIGNHKMAGVLMMGVCNMPLRGLSRMTGGAISQRQLDGLITMFNGKFFKGVGQFFSKKA